MRVGWQLQCYKWILVKSRGRCPGKEIPRPELIGQGYRLGSGVGRSLKTQSVREGVCWQLVRCLESMYFEPYLLELSGDNNGSTRSDQVPKLLMVTAEAVKFRDKYRRLQSVCRPPVGYQPVTLYMPPALLNLYSICSTCRAQGVGFSELRQSSTWAI